MNRSKVHRNRAAFSLLLQPLYNHCTTTLLFTWQSPIPANLNVSSMVHMSVASVCCAGTAMRPCVVPRSLHTAQKCECFLLSACSSAGSLHKMFRHVWDVCRTQRYHTSFAAHTVACPIAHGRAFSKKFYLTPLIFGPEYTHKSVRKNVAPVRNAKCTAQICQISV